MGDSEGSVDLQIGTEAGRDWAAPDETARSHCAGCAGFDVCGIKLISWSNSAGEGACAARLPGLRSAGPENPVEAQDGCRRG